MKVQCNICGKWLPANPPVWCCGILILDKIINRKESKMERLKRHSGKLKWFLKQFLPFIYVTTFTEDDKRRLCIWRMWLGRSFNIQYFNLA